MSDNDLIQKGQDDLIRRGDAREMLQQCGLMGNHPEDPLATMFNEIPAVQPTVSPKQLAAQPDDVAALVETLENVIGEYDLFRKYEYERGLAPLDDEIHEARATLARVKGETK